MYSSRSSLIYSSTTFVSLRYPGRSSRHPLVHHRPSLSSFPCLLLLASLPARHHYFRLFNSLDDDLSRLANKQRLRSSDPHLLFLLRGLGDRFLSLADIDQSDHQSSSVSHDASFDSTLWESAAGVSATDGLDHALISSLFVVFYSLPVC